MTEERTIEVRKKLNVTRAIKQEYDDNNYFDAHYINEVAGIECDIGSYHQEDVIPKLIRDADKIVASNAHKFITDNSKKDVLLKLEELKDSDEEYGHYPELIEMLKKCVELDITFQEFQVCVCDHRVY